MTGLKRAAGPLVYIAASRIPGRAANSFQVLKMAEALLKMEQETLLVAQSGDTAVSSAVNLQQLYGIALLPEMRLLVSQGRFGIHLFNLHAALLARRRRAGVVLSRSIGAAALAARLGLPTIWECHAPPQGLERHYWAALVRAKSFRRLVVISDALRQLMLDRHPEAASRDILVAHDGVDANRFDGLPESAVAKVAAGRNPARPIAAYAGHLYQGRGVDVMLACAEALPDWTFILAGGLVSDIARVEQQCRDRHLRNVELFGFVDNADLPARLAIADVLLMPYARRVMVSGGRLDTARWMSPLKMFEYMAMGRAIISSDLPVLREVLDDETARFAAPDDPRSWIAALEALRDPAIRARLSLSAKRRAARYDWSRRVRQMLAGISGVAGGLGESTSHSVRLSVE